MGEMIYEIVLMTLPSMLEPKMTASWEKGLSQLEHGEITTELYRQKLDEYVAKYVNMIKSNNLSREISVKLSDVNKVYTTKTKAKKEK